MDCQRPPLGPVVSCLCRRPCCWGSGRYRGAPRNALCSAVCLFRLCRKTGCRGCVGGAAAPFVSSPAAATPARIKSLCHPCWAWQHQLVRYARSCAALSGFWRLLVGLEPCLDDAALVAGLLVSAAWHGHCVVWIHTCGVYIYCVKSVTQSHQLSTDTCFRQGAVHVHASWLHAAAFSGHVTCSHQASIL